MNARRLAQLLGDWRRSGSRQGATDLAAAIRLLILDGRLAPGTGLPAERELAAALDVSRTMVASAWERLRADGLVVSRRGAGSWTAVPRGSSNSIGDESRPDDSVIDLTRAVPPAVAGIAAAAEAVLPRLGAELAGHGMYEYGLPELRERLARRYTERGLPTTADEILVTNGAHHALAMALRLFVGPGDRVLIEQPTYPNAIEAIRASHAQPVPVALADDGWDLDGVEATLRQAAPRLAYVVIDFHNPTGHRLDTAGRERLGAALRRARTPVVVDETHLELDLTGAQAPPPLGVFGGDLVLAAGSAGKSHWGGLRVGWVRASVEVVNRLVGVRRGLDLGSPVFEQLVLAELLDAPAEALDNRRAILKEQRDALVAAVQLECPQWTFRVPDGGLSLWCRLPAPVSTRLAAMAQNFGVRVVPGSFFSAHGGLERWLRLPYTQPVDELREAARRLASVAASVAESGAPMVDNGLIPVT